MDNESQFFKMPGSDKLALVLIIFYTLCTFALINSNVKIAGVALFGWLMGLMMFLAPVISLIAMKSEGLTMSPKERRSSENAGKMD